MYIYIYRRASGSPLKTHTDMAACAYAQASRATGDDAVADELLAKVPRIAASEKETWAGPARGGSGLNI